MSKQSLVHAIVLTVAGSLLYAGTATKFGAFFTKYSWIILISSVIFLAVQDRLERKFDSGFVKIILRSISFMVVSVAIYVTAFKYTDGLWWAFIIISGVLYYNAERIARWA